VTPRNFPGSKPTGEIKTVDVPVTTTNINTTGFVGILNAIQQGAGSWQRVGNRVELKSLRFRAVYDTPLGKTGDGTNEVWRIIVAYDRQPTGIALNQADLLRSITEDGTTVTDVWSDLNMNNSERFKILVDIMGTTPDDSDQPVENAPAGVKACKLENPIDRYIKLKGLYTKFNGTANPMTIANFATGAIYVYIVGSNNAGANAAYDLQYSARLRYYDS